jgi:3-mercaptopyruvate sulfurtransferase SseA
MMLCDARQFSHECKFQDIRKTDEIVLYDTNVMAGACRAYWMFRVYGLNVKVLDSPINKWID